MIKINEIEEIPAILYDPNGCIVGEIKTQLQFVDVRVQIKEQKAKGYYLIFNGIRVNIDSKGELDNYPDDMFDKMSLYYAKLM